MIELHPRYVVDEEGRRTAVVLEVAEYEQLVEQLEKQGLLKPAEESFRQGWKEAREGKTKPVSQLSRHSKGQEFRLSCHLLDQESNIGDPRYDLFQDRTERHFIGGHKTHSE